jgi:hypothetical protein
MAGPLPVPRDAAELAVISDLQLGRRAARRRGWTARLVDQPVGDESDVRLLVRCRGTSASVEVLGPVSELPLGRRWQAVRVRGGARQVWCGPERGGSAQLLDFVADLLERDDDELARRYRPLG